MSSNPSEWTRKLWERLQDMPSNEKAWKIIEEAGAELLRAQHEPYPTETCTRDKPGAGIYFECQCHRCAPKLDRSGVVAVGAEASADDD